MASMMEVLGSLSQDSDGWRQSGEISSCNNINQGICDIVILLQEEIDLQEEHRARRSNRVTITPGSLRTP